MTGADFVVDGGYIASRAERLPHCGGCLQHVDGNAHVGDESTQFVADGAQEVVFALGQVFEFDDLGEACLVESSPL